MAKATRSHTGGAATKGLTRPYGASVHRVVNAKDSLIKSHLPSSRLVIPTGLKHSTVKIQGHSTPIEVAFLVKDKL